MKLTEELQARGFIHQTSTTSEGLVDLLEGEKRTIYHGIDPSSDSAQAGNFVIWMLLKHLAKAGHKIVFLVGGGTGMIGDPKPDAERTLSDREEVTKRVAKIKAQAERVLGITGIQFVDNYDWLSKLELIPFLRDVGKHFSVNELIKKEAIARRLDSEVGLSYTEFAYPLLQGYDYFRLYEDYGCTLQVGGADQWGNMLSGVELIRRKVGGEAYVITAPLIVDKTTGKKFGKSEGNSVWLDAEKTSPFAFYQFWLNVSDVNVIDYLKVFTLLTIDEIKQIEIEHNTTPELRLAQKALAKEVTTTAVTDNNNRTAPEVRHIFTKAGYQLGGPGSATWAFTKTADGYRPNSITELSATDGEVLANLIENLEEQEEVQDIYTSADEPE